MKLKLQTKFFCAYLLMSLLIIGAFSAIFYHYTSSILIERETKSVMNLNNAFLTQTESMISDMDTVSINIGYSNIVKDNLYDNLNIDAGSNDFRNLANLFVSINGADIKVDQINLYDFSGHVFQVGMKSNSTRVNTNTLDWIDEAKQLNGKKLISSPYPSTTLHSGTDNPKIPTWYLSLYRTYNNKYKREVGAIETVKRCSSVFKYLISYQKKNKNDVHIYIYNKAGALLYPYLPTETKASIPNYYLARKGDVNSLRYHNKQNQTAEIIAYETSSYTGWTYITVQPESLILAPVQNLLHLLMGVVVIMLIFCAFLSYQFSKHLIQPIRKLQQIFRDTVLENLGNKEIEPLNTSFDEIESLNQEFMKMSANLKTSMNELIDTRQQEIKSRSLALQSQINPHFYYNTLSSIIVLAENNQSEEVAIMCRNLTKIMRYITDGSSSIVTLKKETDYIRQYLYCMKVRYQTSLNYSIDIPDCIENETIPKLIIQPLVENALKYGTNCQPPWQIHIEGVIAEDHWVIHVIDSGNGFTDESIHLIRSRMEAAELNAGMPEMQINGMGLLNVYIRWKLFCQDTMIFEFGNTTEGHGIVSIGRKIKKQE